MDKRKMILIIGFSCLQVVMCMVVMIWLIPGKVFAACGYYRVGETPTLRCAGKFSINTQISGFVGDFGDQNNHNTTIAYFTETFKYTRTNIGEIGLSVPYIYRNGGGVTPGESSLASTQAVPKRTDGIGDLLLKGRYYLINEKGNLPGIDLTGRVKFPTASHNRGLGTGRFDFSGGISLLKHFGDFIGLLDTDLVVRKRPNGSTLKPLRVDYSVGVGYPFTTQTAGYLFVEGSSKTNRNQKSENAPLEIVAAVTYKPQQKLSFNGYILTGLTDGSPDIGASLGVTRYF